MNFRTTLILVALLIGAIVGFVMVEMYSPPLTPQMVDGQSQALFSAKELPTARVQAVTLTDPQTTATAERRVTRWWQTEPIEFPVGSSQMDRLVDDVATLRFMRQLPANDDSTPTLAEAGLEPAAMRITLDFEGDQLSPITLRLGDRTIGTRRYAAVDGRPDIYIVETALGELTASDMMAALRFASPNAPNVGGAQEVTLTVRGETVRMVHHHDGWRFASPHVGRVSSLAIRDLMQNVGTVMVQQWLPTTTDMAAYGLDRPVMALTITQATPDGEAAEQAPDSPTAPGTTTVLRIGGAVDASGALRYASWGDGTDQTSAVFAVRSDELAKFAWPVDALRDKRLTGLRTTDMVDVKVQSNVATVGSFHAERSTDGWSFGSPSPGYPVDSGAIADLLAQFAEAEAVAFADAALAEGEPIVRVALTPLGTAEAERVAIYPAPDAAVPPAEEGSMQAKLTYWFVQRGDEPVGCVVPRPQLDRLMQPLLALRHRVVYDAPKDRLTSITIEQPGMGQRTFIRGTVEHDDDTVLLTDDWVLRGETGYDQRALHILRNSLSPLRTTRWVDDRELSGPVTRLTVTAQNREPVTLTLATDDMLGSIEGSYNDGTFAIGPDLADAVTAEFRQRTALPVGTRGIKQIDVQHDGVTHTLSIDEQGQYLRDGRTDGITQQAAARLFNQVAGLRVERYLEDDSPTPLFAVKLTIVRNDGGASLTVGIPAESTGKVWLSGMIRGKRRDTWAQVDAAMIDAAMQLMATPTAADGG